MPPDEPYDEHKVVVQYPPEPAAPDGEELVLRRGGQLPLPHAVELAEHHRDCGASSATVYRRTWTPGPWVAVDPPAPPMEWREGGLGAYQAPVGSPDRPWVAVDPQPKED